MNQRIQALIYQLNNEVGIHWTNEDKIKFAELIVRECAGYIFVLDAEPVSHKSAARMLIDHFGVEK
jgi:hypothetical protein